MSPHKPPPLMSTTAPASLGAYPVLRHLDDPDDLERYLDLRAERDRLDAELDALAPVVLAALEAEDDGQAEARGFVLSAEVRRTYGYSAEVTETEAYLCDLRAAERASGAATVERATGYVKVSRSPATRADRARALGAEAVTAALAA